MTAKKKAEESLSDLSVDELTQMRNEIIVLLQTLEDEHRSASISDESYKSTKEANQKKLDKIRPILNEFGIGDNDGKPPEKKKEQKPAPAESEQPDASSEPASKAVSFDESRFFERIESRLNGEVEKLKVLIDALKEGGTASEERMQRLTESIGEIRSMMFNTDNSVKSGESKIELLEENMAELDPRKVEKEFSKRDQSLGVFDLRVEKLERKMQDTTTGVHELQDILTSVGGLHNIADIDHEVTKKLEAVRDSSKEIKRMTERTEKMFLELNKRMDEFFVYRAKQEALDEIVRDVIKSIDSVNTRLENTVNKSYVKDLRDSFKGIEEKISKINSTMSSALPLADLMLPKEIQEMSSERESINLLLVSLDEEARNKKISNEEYVHAKEANQKKLEELEDKIRQHIQNPGAIPTATENPAPPKTQDGEAVQATTPAPEKAEEGIVSDTDKASAEGKSTPVSEEPDTNLDGLKNLQEGVSGNKEDSSAKTSIAVEAPAEPVVEKEPKESSGENKIVPAVEEPAKEDISEKVLHEKEKEGLASENNEPKAVDDSKTETTQLVPDKEEPQTKKEKLLFELDDSFKKGQLSKQAYEHSKEIVMKISE
ncbi:MAG: hypothetical protein KAJ24_04590 [Candidatus Aenigmarchaeota archaeon]|nr:hypothetical protein [Candidatus Aenigmarchaeota archaeon]